MKFPFPKEANAVARGSLVLLIFFLLIGGSFAMIYRRIPTATGEGAEVVQPILFNHRHHVQGLGLDCRYCHTSVEKSSRAGFPDTATCYGCHAKIWNQAAMLEPVRKSGQNHQSLHWFQINRLPDYVYFDHSIHISKGVGCVSCHGEVSKMAVVTQRRSFLMRDCLQCHEAPTQNIRPRSEITNDSWQPNEKEFVSSQELMKVYHVQPPPITNCSVCHR